MIRREVRRLWRRVPAWLARGGYVASDALGWKYTVPGELRACPACGDRRIEHLHPLPLHGRDDGKRVGFVSGCRRCGIVFANPMPTAEVLAKLYSPGGDWGVPRQGEADEKRPSIKYLAKMFAPVRAEFDIANPPPGSAALDFGCGSGDLLDGLQQVGWTTCGIEPAVKSAFVRHRELQAIPTSPTFELAVAHHVLEHMRDPLNILRALYGCLKPGGFLFVSVPRLDALGRHRDYRYCINDRLHVVSYTRDAMTTLMGMAGFAAVDLNPPLGEEGSDWRALQRLRMLGRKGGATTLHPEPLVAARRVFEEWFASEQPPWLSGWPPTSVRAAAAAMNFERGRRAGRRGRPQPRGES